jgi:hypothetical protein
MRLLHRLSRFFRGSALEEADRGEAAGAGARDSVHTVGCHAPDGQHRERDGGARRPEGLDADWRSTGLRRRLEHGPEEKIVQATRPRGLFRFFDGVNRTPDYKIARDRLAHTPGGDAARGQMDAMGPRGKSDIQAIVHENAGTRPGRLTHAPGDDAKEVPGLEPALADLDEMDTGACRGNHAADEFVFPPVTARTAIGDEADYRAHGLDARRAATSAASSPNPAAILTIPSPDTAPRTKLFVMTSRTNGSHCPK